MDFIKQWVLSVTFAALAGTLIYLLAPKGATERAMRTVVAVFLIAAIFLPFASLRDIDLSLPAANELQLERGAKQLEDAVAERALLSAREAVCAVIRQELELREIRYGQIVLNMDIQEDTSIGIREAYVELAEGNPVSPQELEKQLLEATGIDIRVILVGDDALIVPD